MLLLNVLLLKNFLYKHNTKERIIHKLNEDEQLVEIKSLTADDQICYSINFGDIEIENIPELNRNSRGAKIF